MRTSGPASPSMRAQASSTARALSSSPLRVIGTTTTWMGATRGGMIRPASSPWAMISPPMIRVDSPHEVWKGCCRRLSRSL